MYISHLKKAHVLLMKTLQDTSNTKKEKQSDGASKTISLLNLECACATIEVDNLLLKKLKEKQNKTDSSLCSKKIPVYFSFYKRLIPKIRIL